MEIAIEKRYRLELGNFARINITLVGCGGTGSFLALHLARLAYHLKERKGMRMEITLFDHDRVEPKNIGRQNFCPAEVGEPKAWVLMQRLNATFGLQTVARVEKFSGGVIERKDSMIDIIVGCVDGSLGRRAIAEEFAHLRAGGWWLDCGNHEHAGQVLLGNMHIAKPEISPLGFCGGLPLPSMQHPELLTEEPAPELPASCADLALRDAQSLMINQQIAGIASQYLYRMTLTRDLDIYATYLDLRSCSMRSVPITGEPKKQKKGATE